MLITPLVCCKFPSQRWKYFIITKVLLRCATNAHGIKKSEKFLSNNKTNRVETFDVAHCLMETWKCGKSVLDWRGYYRCTAVCLRQSVNIKVSFIRLALYNGRLKFSKLHSR